MTRRSFFSLLAAPVVAPMVPETKPEKIGIVLTGDCTASTGPSEPLEFKYVFSSTPEETRQLIDAINQDVKRGAVSLTATEVKR